MRDISALKVTDLKAELKKRGLPTGGLKKDLIERLQVAIREEEEEEEEKVEKDAGSTDNGDTDRDVDEDCEPSVNQDATAGEPPDKERKGEDPAAKEEDKVEWVDQLSAPVTERDAPDGSTVEVSNVIQGEEVDESAEKPAVENGAKETEIVPEATSPDKGTAKEQEEIKGKPAKNETTGEDESTDVMEVDTEESKREETKDNKIEVKEVEKGSKKERSESPYAHQPIEEIETKTKEQKLTNAITPQRDPSPPSPQEPLKQTGETPTQNAPSPMEPDNLAADVEIMDAIPDVPAEMRKRKRRSASPPPSPSLSEIQTEEQERSPKKLRQEDDKSNHITPTTPRRQSVSTPSKPDIRFKSLAAGNPQIEGIYEDEDEDHHVPTIPAIHPATTALYIRDLIRPIKPAALREHLVSLATKNSTEIPQNGDVIKTFYLNSLKTHAFVVFDTINYATRVRAGLAGRRFPPNEKQRKPLWVDFVPEEMVSEWIDKEDKAGSGMTKWIVNYEVVATEEEGGGVRVWHGEIGATAPSNTSASAQARKLEMRISTRDGRMENATIVQNADGGPPVEIIGPNTNQHHNSNLKPANGQKTLESSPSSSRRPPPDMPRADRERLAQSSSSSYQNTVTANTERTFKTIDQLFLSTRTKPKLYFLPVPKETAQKRFDEWEEAEKKSGKSGPDPRERPGAPQWGGKDKPGRRRRARVVDEYRPSGVGGRNRTKSPARDRARERARDRARERERERSRTPKRRR